MVANKIVIIPVLESEKHTIAPIINNPVKYKYLSISFVLAKQYNPIGKLIDKTAAKPAGFSKLPVIGNSE